MSEQEYTPEQIQAARERFRERLGYWAERAAENRQRKTQEATQATKSA